MSVITYFVVFYLDLHDYPKIYFKVIYESKNYEPLKSFLRGLKIYLLFSILSTLRQEKHRSKKETDSPNKSAEIYQYDIDKLTCSW